MAYKIAICDDTAADADYEARLVRDWAFDRRLPVSVRCFPSGESFSFAYAGEKDWDILLLDIEMGGLDGVSLAKRLRRDNEAVQIVFITGYSDYITEGYEVAALHYLIKPVKTEKLRSVLDRAVEKLQKNERTLKLEVAGEMVRLPIYQIRWAEVRQNYVTIHAGEDYTVKMPLGNFVQKLDDRFYRVGRSAVVNLGCIRRVTKTEILLLDGAVVPLPRGAYEGVNRAIIGME